jgi:hypothetical protein
MAPRTEQHHRTNDYYCRDNGSDCPSSHPRPVIKISSVITCSISKTGAIFASRLVVKITHEILQRFTGTNLWFKRSFLWNAAPAGQ